MEKSEKITVLLRQEINTRKYETGSRFPSETELADRFGVNQKTINKAVSQLVAEGLLQRGVRGSGTHVKTCSSFPRMRIAYIGKFYHPYYANILNGIQIAALEQDCIVDVLNPLAEQFNSVVSKVRNSDIRGIISSAYGTIEGGNLPVLYVDEESAGEYYKDFVACNSYQGGYEMMRALISRGHKNIVLLTYITDTRQRVIGFQDAMREAGIERIPERLYTSIQCSDYDTETLFKKMTADFPGFTAIASTGDDCIFRVISFLEKKNIPWCGKIAMTGFGNVSGISNLLPIATVDQHPFHIGKKAFSELLRKIENPDTVVRERIDVELLGLENIPLLARRPPFRSFPAGKEYSYSKEKRGKE